jgi:hypothetical protein
MSEMYIFIGKKISNASSLWLISGMMIICYISACNSSQEGPQAIRSGRQIRLKPVDLTFEIPQDWLDWYEKENLSNNLHLSLEELEAVKEGAGEWDTEFASVVNSLLPFDHCAAHIGGEGWGNEGVSYGDLQARVYIVDETLDQVKDRIESEGVAQVRKLTGQDNRVDRDDRTIWHKRILAFHRWYYDYGSTAYVDFRLRQFDEQTVVLVFMYTAFQSQEEDIMFILDSFDEKRNESQLVE